jgi:hypothetical protein
MALFVIGHGLNDERCRERCCVEGGFLPLLLLIFLLLFILLLRVRQMHFTFNNHVEALRRLINPVHIIALFHAPILNPTADFL